jgi:hypothetical protein
MVEALQEGKPLALHQFKREFPEPGWPGCSKWLGPGYEDAELLSGLRRSNLIEHLQYPGSVSLSAKPYIPVAQRVLRRPENVKRER